MISKARRVLQKCICLSPLLALAQMSAALSWTGPSTYLSLNDSPLRLYPGFTLADFETGGLPGSIQASNGFSVAPATTTDSVDGDDGAIDGSGQAGHSFYPNASSVSLTFTTTPTNAGFVWTDVGIVSSGNFGVTDLTVSAFGPGDVFLGTVGPFTLGDGSINGQTAEDRYFGASDPGGIHRLAISVSNSADWEIDHVQYSNVPEPMAAILMLPLIMLSRRSR